MASGNYLFTSESVSMGHPDKLADQISDSVLDAMLAGDPYSRVACETMVTTELCVIAGEITSKSEVDIEKLVRSVMRDVGYTDAATGIGCDSCEVIVRLDKQSPDIAMGVDKDGAGDQGLMFGYACDDFTFQQDFGTIKQGSVFQGSGLASSGQQKPGYRRI